MRKDDEGKASFTEFAELGEAHDAAPLLEILDHAEGLVSDEDVAELTESLPPGDSAAILVFEHTWALRLRQAVVASGVSSTSPWRERSTATGSPVVVGGGGTFPLTGWRAV